MSNFVSLHNHTCFSLLDSLITPRDLLLKAKSLDQKAVAITDHGTFAGLWEAYKAYKETGVKLIVGLEVYFKHAINDQNETFKHLILLAYNQKGYVNLLSLNKSAFDKTFPILNKPYPITDWDLLSTYKDGLICLTSCGNGIISQEIMNKNFDLAAEYANKLKNIFGDNLYLEVQTNNMKKNSTHYNNQIDQNFINRQIIKLSEQLNIEVVPTCNAHYLSKEDYETHDTLLAINSHQPAYSNARLKYTVNDFYLKSEEEVLKFFSRNYSEEFARKICDNTIKIADKCENPDWVDPKYSNPSGKELPEFPVKDQKDYSMFVEWLSNQSETIKSLDEDKSYLRFKCYEAIKEYGKFNDKEYLDRLEEELDVLYYCGVSSYMLIVADYIEWCRDNGISTGTGRGSVGGSLVAFLLKIHCADPIKYGLVFPRFHNKLKQSYSDIDADFSKKDRHKVIKYITQKYGHDKVANISNIIYMTPKVYVKDVARAYGLTFDNQDHVKFGNNVADTISSDLKSIDDAYEKSPLFAEYANRYSQFLKYKQISELPRAFGTHAAGIVISKRTLNEINPLRYDKDGNTVLEYDKDVIEENGLVKMDILGISTLDIIEKTYELIKDAKKEPPKINYDEYDQKTYDLISNGDTFGVFQFGTSAGTVDLCKKIKPTSIEDLAIITTLARPASKDIREEFINTKFGKKKVTLLHPRLENALKSTFGYPLYDESLLILAKDVAGWDLNEADKLRKLTKEKGKNPQKVKQWKQDFINGSLKNGLTEEEAEKIWVNIVEPFGKYSFNKSHAILYSMISYHTAYLKAHFPVEFLIANLMQEVTSNAQDVDSNIEKIKFELRKHNVNIMPPNINKSKNVYSIDNNILITALNAINKVGDNAIEDIFSKRPFSSFYDFMRRVDSTLVRADAIQSLAAVGCFDDFGISRKNIYLYCKDYREKLKSWLKRHDEKNDVFEYNFPDNLEWLKSELYAFEIDLIGEASICRPYVAYGDFFKVKHEFIKNLKLLKDKSRFDSTRVIVKDVFEFKIKKETSKFYGQSMLRLKVEDAFGETCSVVVFPDRLIELEKFLKKRLKVNKIDKHYAIAFRGSVNIYEDEFGLILDSIYDINPPPSKPKDLAHKKISSKSKNNIEIKKLDDVEDYMVENSFVNYSNDND